MTRTLAKLFVLLAALCILPVAAQTRAWLDRAQISYGETATGRTRPSSESSPT